MYSQTDGLTDGRMDSRTHGRTDELIWGGLGNLRFRQVNLIFSKPDIEIPGGSEKQNWTDRD